MSTTAPRVEDDEIQLTVTRGPAGTARVVAVGELDGCSAPAIREALSGLIRSGCTTVTLDLSDLGFMDSSGHRGLRAVADLAESLGGELLLEGCSRPVRRFLDLTASALSPVPSAHRASALQRNRAAVTRSRAIGF